MSDAPHSADWWLGVDGKWYPPEQWTGPPGTSPPVNPAFEAPKAETPSEPTPSDQQPPEPDQPPAPGYWKASDGNWYPPQQAESQPPPYIQPHPTATQEYTQTPPAAPGGGVPGWAKGCLISVAVVAVFGLLGLACVAIVANEPTNETDGAGEGPAPTDAAETTSVPPTESAEATCTYIAPDRPSEQMKAELVFVNTFGDVPGVEVTYALLDGEGGTRFLTETWTVEFPKANEQIRVSAETLEQVPPSLEGAAIGCKVLAIEKDSVMSTLYGGAPSPTDADTCTVQGPNSSGVIQIKLDATNPFESTTDIRVFWALRAAGPVRISSGSYGVDLVGEGEPIRLDLSTGTVVPAWAGGDGLTCAVVGFGSD